MIPQNHPLDSRKSPFIVEPVLSPAGVAYRVEAGLPPADQEEAKYLAGNLGSTKTPALVEREVFEALLPPLPFPEVLSERGELSKRRIAGKSIMDHRERLARALLDRFDSFQATERIEFSTAKAEGVQDFALDPRKFTEYLLNRKHPKGGAKAKLFVEVLGIEPSDWAYLANQIEQGMTTAPIYRADKSKWGFSHGALVIVTGRNGKTAVLETGWLVDVSGTANFVTAYPYDGPISKPLFSPQPLVVEPDLSGEQRWAAIYERAVTAGEAAANAVQPTPMIVEGYGTEWEGACGFGWVRFPTARHPMAKWLLKTDRGSRSRPGVSVWSKARTQSVDRNSACPPCQ